MNLDNVLDRLEEGQLLRRLTEAELAYIFKHTLTQESVYTAMLKTRRAELHHAVATALETLYPDQLEQNAAMLALHCERAGLVDKAFTYAALAGDVAARAYAHTEALMFYDRALAATTRLPHCDLRRVRQIYATRGRVLEVMGDHPAAIENYRAMILFAQQFGDLTMEADATNRLLTARGIIGQGHHDARELQEALDLARRSGDAELIGRALWNIGLSTRFSDPSRSIDYFVQALELARANGLPELAAYAQMDLAQVLQLAGRWREANDQTAQVLPVFRALDNRPMIANALGMMGEAYYYRGNSDAARAAAQEAVETSRAIDNPWGIGYAEWLTLYLDVDAGDFTNILPRARDIFSIADQLHMSLFAGLTHFALARGLAEMGQYDAGLDSVDQGLRLLEPFGAPVWVTIATASRALILLRSQRHAEADAIFESLCTQAQQPDFNHFSLIFAGLAVAEYLYTRDRLDDGVRFCDSAVERLETDDLLGPAAELRYWRARFHVARGNSAGAETDLTQALAAAERARNCLLLWRLHAALADLYATQQPDPARAHSHRDRAVELVHSIAATIPDPAWRASFFNRPDILKIIPGGPHG